MNLYQGIPTSTPSKTKLYSVDRRIPNLFRCSDTGTKVTSLASLLKTTKGCLYNLQLNPSLGQAGFSEKWHLLKVTIFLHRQGE